MPRLHGKNDIAGGDRLRGGRQVAAAIVRRGHHQLFIGKQMPAFHPLPVALPHANGQIDTLLLQVDYRQTGQQAHRDLRMSRLKARQPRQQPVAAKGGEGRQGQFHRAGFYLHHPRGVGDVL